MVDGSYAFPSAVIADPRPATRPVRAARWIFVETTVATAPSSSLVRPHARSPARSSVPYPIDR